MLKDRAPRVLKLLAQLGLEGMVFLDLANIRYLCGFSGTDGALVVQGERSWFLTDSRYVTQAHGQVTAGEIIEYRVKSDGILTCLKNQGIRKVGFEADTLPYATVQEFREKSGEQMEWSHITLRI